jgi:hypothetical protein
MLRVEGVELMSMVLEGGGGDPICHCHETLDGFATNWNSLKLTTSAEG